MQKQENSDASVNACMSRIFKEEGIQVRGYM
jgi:hypothetical protein